MTSSAAYDQFSRTAEQAAKAVIANYSTSFGLATRFLAPNHRHHIRNIYALVRIADEIVDGLAADAGLSLIDQRRLLENFVTATRAGIERGISDNLVIHAFAQTALATGITSDLIDPFFDSMRTDLETSHVELGSESADASTDRDPAPAGHDLTTATTSADHDPIPPTSAPPTSAAPTSAPPTKAPAVNGLRGFDSDAHSRYVYGSAEVVGLMCLTVFLVDQHRTPAQRERLEFGARQLGAAFQNINFLRDLADDCERLGRSYLTTHARLTETEKAAWVRTIREQLAHAQETMTLLPRDARAAVRSAAALFTALTDRIAVTPIEHLYTKRIRVPNAVKARLAAQALLTSAREPRDPRGLRDPRNPRESRE